MSDLDRKALLADLIRDEDLRTKPYLDNAKPVRKLTIGIGRNLDDRGISREEAVFLCHNDIAAVEEDLDRKLPWWRTLSSNRQRVLANMCFNMGIGNSKKGLLSFRNTLAAMERGDYEAAARGMLASKWARQVGARAERLAMLMRAG